MRGQGEPAPLTVGWSGSGGEERPSLSASGLGAPRLQAGLGSAPPLSPKAPPAVALVHLQKVAATSLPLALRTRQQGMACGGSGGGCPQRAPHGRDASSPGGHEAGGRAFCQQPWAPPSAHPASAAS